MSFLRALAGQYRGVPRSVYFLAAGRAVNSLGSFVILLATIILSETFLLSPSAIGSVLFACGLAQAAGTLVSGSLLDRFPRHRVFGLFMVGHAIGFGAAAFARTGPQIAVCLVAGFFFGGMLRPGLMSMTSDVTPIEHRHAAFSLIYLSHNMGMIVAPLFAGFLYGTRSELVFWGDAGTTLVCAGIVVLAFASPRQTRKTGGPGGPGHGPVPASAPRRVVGDRSTRRPLPVVITALLTTPSLMRFSIAMFLLNFVYGQHTFALPLRMLSLYGSSGPIRFGLLLTANATFVILATSVITTLTHRMHSTSAMLLAGITYVVGFGAVGLSGVFGFQVLLVIIWTTGEILMATHASVFITAYAPEHARARFLATLPTIWWAGGALGPFLIGPLVDAAGLQVVWPALAMVALAGVYQFDRARRIDRRQDRVSIASGGPDVQS